MSFLNNPIVFYSVAFTLLLLSFLTLAIRNIFYSLILAIGVFFLVGLIFFILGSEYNAVIQVAIYGIAVPIILGLAIMFTNHKNKSEPKEGTLFKHILILFSGVFILAVVYLALMSIAITPIGFNSAEIIKVSFLQNISAITTGIFVKYVWAFELLSLLLTIIIVGFVTLRKEQECKR